MIATLLGTAVAKGPPQPGPDPLPGAIFTTNSTGTDVNQNVFYADKAAVYLNGGPKHTGAAGLPEGDYFVQVTNPSGSLILGRSITASVHVDATGTFAQLYQLTAILKTGSSSFMTLGYDDTDNPGGEYKVWVSKSAEFLESVSKTDNFKVRKDDGGGTNGDPDAWLRIVKFYDTNADGMFDAGEPPIKGWLFHVSDNIHLDRFTTGTDPNFEIALKLAIGSYTVYEGDALETSWIHTTATIAEVTLVSGDDKTVRFGNVCLGQRGGLTLGFWSNKNGQAATDASDVTYLASLNLRNANGSNFDPTAKSQIPKWLLSANAVNMANMLSAQLTAMVLNVSHPSVSKVDESFIIYRPELNVITPTITFNSGFITLKDLITAANKALGENGYTVAAGADRTKQELLKNALDDANNNKAIYVLPPDPISTFTF